MAVAVGFAGPILTAEFEADDTIVEGQLVMFDTTDDLVIGTTVADQEDTIGIALKAAVDGGRLPVRLLGHAIVPMIAGGTVTRGLKVKVEGADGRVVNIGASDDAGMAVGRALKSSATDGDLIPVLILERLG